MKQKQLGLVFFASCLSASQADLSLSNVPQVDEYCLAAQRVVTQTELPMDLVIHDDFDAFVRSKAVIEGPTIQQFNWYDESGAVVGISCKLKSADHLNLIFGDGSAGPDGSCQDMNRAVYALVAPTVEGAVGNTIIFDPIETVTNEDQPGMTGPDWLAPYTMTYRDESGTLHIAAKGFVVNFADPRFRQAPARFRGVHYCHLIAPDHLRRLLEGFANPGTEIGRIVDSGRPMPTQ